ncbi:response regulator receiver protein [Magnetococcus marinus MC-1]|uniref:Response regulator receiver protein n=2 Tax=Magnetococcus TaxID=162171 RepID=A0L9A5_MAGMM|nr:response regulator receiver protein [Magnetococcus marinus MC-1]
MLQTCFQILYVLLIRHIENQLFKDSIMEKNILLIEDDLITQTLLKDMLEDYGFFVFTASDGNEGTKMMEHNHFDLVLTDIIMPEKEGLQLIRETKWRWPHLKVIAMSTGGSFSGGPDYLQTAKDFGAVASIVKPIDSDNLLKTIRSVLDSEIQQEAY